MAPTSMDCYVKWVMAQMKKYTQLSKHGVTVIDLQNNRNRQKLQSFLNKCLCLILNISWPDVITSEEFWKTTD